MSGVKPLRNDCFALPPGVDWTPVDEALERLKSALSPVVAPEKMETLSALGRVLAEPVTAPRAHPPHANSAVDGYGFAHAALGHPPHDVPLIAGRAAAGVPFGGVVPAGQAVRVLTGAALPAGVDTVVLEEDTELDGDRLRFGKGLKVGANCRPAGEDVGAGEALLTAGRRLTPGDLALLASVGAAELSAYRPLRVGVLSTGDEIRPLGSTAEAHQIFDANRPMLMGLLARWGYEIVDLGHVRDDRDAVRAALAKGAGRADAILTSGGASAGDEDHISAVLREEGVLSSWRIALKPGRPLALALWDGVPVFGLPGNPVAAFVCALIFARPALSLLSGAGWCAVEGMELAAGFSKAKKHGRAEYLRARRRGDRVEVFASEGSGRVSGLSWAEGLVILPHEGREIAEGDPLRYVPFTEFGL